MSYRRKLILIFMIVSIVPLTFTYAFFMFREYNIQRVQVITDFQERIEYDVYELNSLLLEYIQKLQITRHHPRIQSVLRTPVPLQMSTILFDFYTDMQSLYRAFGDASPFWRFTIYTLNPNVISGTFIRDVSFMDEHAYKTAINNADDEYILTISNCAHYLYILGPEANLAGEVYAIAQVTLSLEGLRRYITGDYPEGTQAHFIVTSEDEAHINLIGDLVDFNIDDYYHIAVPVLDSGIIALYLPTDYFTGQLIYPLLSITIIYVIVVVIFALLTMLISRF